MIKQNGQSILKRVSRVFYLINFNIVSSGSPTLIKDLSSDKIERIAHETGTYSTLQKMRTGEFFNELRQSDY